MPSVQQHYAGRADPVARGRDTGLDAIGRLRWGSHFCIFYETKTDLLDILVAYFKAGLEANELCLWIVSPVEFSSVAAAHTALREVFPEIECYIREKRFEILGYSEFFHANGTLKPARALNHIRENLARARKLGLDGLRANGSSTWVRQHLGRRSFREYERGIEALVDGRCAIIACTYPLKLSSAALILEAARVHQFAVTVRNGVWKRVEIGDIEAARSEARPRNRELEQLSIRQREVLQHIAEGQNTKEIAALLGVSVKTVEAHRLQLMRRLKIANVPGLVRFAIRSGLVAA